MRLRNSIVLITALIALTCTSCKKNAGPVNSPSPPTPFDPFVVPPQPAFRLTEYRNSSSATHTDLVTFRYDSLNRLTAIRNENFNHVEVALEYDGDRLKSLVYYDLLGLETHRYENPITFSADGDTITITYIDRYIDHTDTTLSICLFEDNRIREIRTEIRSSDASRPTQRAREIFNYNNDGNLVDCKSVSNTFNQTLWQVGGVDGFKNPLKDISKLVFLFADIEKSSAMSDNNVTIADYWGGDIREFEYTYSLDRYPLTKKLRSESFVRYEYTYER